MMKSDRIRILDIFPDIYTDELKEAKRYRERLSKILNERTNGLVELDTVFVKKGSASIEDAFDEAVNTPYILQEVKLGEEKGYDAIVIDCFGDPGLSAARQLVKIPVVGANQSACHIAAQLSGKFSIINILRSVEPLVRELLLKYGLEEKVASMRVINVPVLGLEKDPQNTVKVVVETIKKMVFEDGASAVVFGCTGMAFLLEEVNEMLKKEDIEIPIIEPLNAAIAMAIALVMMGVSQSKIEYPPPIPKKRVLDFKIL